MAIDKNSKAYQALLNSWYTEDQINQMHNQTASWQSASEVVANTPTPNYENQWAGNYVYNETTWYYENTTPSSTPTRTSTTQTNTNQNVNTNQWEKAGTTVTENTQSGALKPLSNDYYNQTSDEALTKIKDNLNNYRQTNPEYFSDYESFKKNFSYDSRNDIQKQTLDTRYTGYTKWLELSNVPTTDLYTQYKDGQISQSDLENLRIANPEKYAQLQTQINKWNIISAYDEDSKPETMNFQELAYNMIASALNKMNSGDYGTSEIFDDYENKMNSPEMLEIQDKTTELEEDIKNVQDDIDRMKKEVEEEYAGKGASRAKINAIIADRTYDLQLQLRTLNNEYTKYATQYNNRANQYQNEFQLQLQEYQLNMQARNQQMNELGFAMDLMNFETNEQKQEREWNYWVKQQEYTNWNINSSDYQTRYKAALKSVENLLSQYQWIPMQRSAEQMAEDILTSMDQNWTSLGDELTKINKFIQQKPEYKYLYNQTYRPATATWTTTSTWIGQTIKIGDQEYVEYNGERYTAEDFNKRFSWGEISAAAKPYTVVDESLLENSLRPWVWQKNLGRFLAQSKNMNGSKWGQCGKFVNDYLQAIWVTWAANRYYDNDLSTKLNSVNSYTPKVWTIAVFDYGYKSKSDWINHGHVGIVTKVYADWSFDMRDSNGDLSKPETIRTVHVTDSKGLKGFFDPSQPPLSSSTTSIWGTTWNSSSFTTAWNNIALHLGSVSATSTFNDQLQKYLDNGDYTSAFEYITTQAKQSTDSDTRSAINSAESAISALVSIQQWLDAFYAAWGDTWIFAGTAEQVANRIWKTTDPELKKLATQINTAIQQYRKAISGAAFTESEAREYAAIFPSTKNDKELNTALIDGTLQTMLQNLNANYAQILGTQTYTDLLKDYQDKTWNIYDYYWNKQWLTQYLKKNWYMNTGNTSNQTRSGLKLGSTTNSTTKGTWVLRKSAGSKTSTTKTTVVEPNMSEYQSSTTSNLWNWLLSRTVGGVKQYSYDWWKTRH